MKILSPVSKLLSKFQIRNVPLFKKLHYIRLKSYFSQETYTYFDTFYHYSTVIKSPFKFGESLPKTGKHFQETENEFAHAVMEKSPNYLNSLSVHPLQKEFIKYTPDKNSKAIDEFIKITEENLSVGSCLSCNDFISTVQNLCSVLHNASDDEIKSILHHLCLWPPAPHTTAQNFVALWNALDKECVKRLKYWDVNQQLLVADYWFHLRLSRIGKYNREVIYNLARNIDSLSNHQVVQLMFYINLQRKFPSSLFTNLEKKLELVIKNLSIEELGIICLGFFKTETQPSNTQLTECITKEFMQNVDNVNTVTVAAILKFLRKSLNRSLIGLYILTLHKCINSISKWDIPTSVHLALFSSECNVYHPLLLNCVSDKLAEHISEARIKDCAKLMVCLSMFNHANVKFLDLFLSELLKEERKTEFHLYPVHVVHAAIYYAYMGYFNYNLLSTIFNKLFFEKTCENFPSICTVFAELDCCTEIECQDYKGPRLDVSVRKSLSLHRGNLPSKSEKQNTQTRLLSDVYESLVEILGSEKDILIRHILPHCYSPDVIVRLSGSEIEHLSNLYFDYPSDQILKPPSNELWASFVIGGIYSFAYKSTQMTGITSMKLRQLKKIGYEVVFTPYFNISRNKSLRKKFLEEKLNELKKIIK